MASSSITLPSLQGPQLKSHFLGRKILPGNSHKLFFSVSKQRSTSYPKASAKFDLFQILGGRGLCNGEKGIEEELKKSIEETAPSLSASAETEQSSGSEESSVKAPEDGFDKELMGLTGGFPGGETGLRKFIEKNPPPPKKATPAKGEDKTVALATSKKMKAPELPLLMPGMIAIVKNPNNPFYMYCGIVQRITDGRAGVLFEGGNWDKLITFRLEELERREKGPPAKNPRSVVLEALVEKDSE
uniref:Chlororespiratory reduction31 n=1 Tax=California macrophylla TaxID=337344 RepID=A0A0F7GZW0_9ROSI